MQEHDEEENRQIQELEISYKFPPPKIKAGVGQIVWYNLVFFVQIWISR
jgi:hypothetical protein